MKIKCNWQSWQNGKKGKKWLSYWTNTAGEGNAVRDEALNPQCTSLAREQYSFPLELRVIQPNLYKYTALYFQIMQEQ